MSAATIPTVRFVGVHNAGRSQVAAARVRPVRDDIDRRVRALPRELV